MLHSSIQSLPSVHKGKVRDSYAVGQDKLLIITSDRLSAFDVVLDDPIPGKGNVLNQMALFWFEQLKDIVPNHLTGIDPVTVVTPDEASQVVGRSVVAKRLKAIPIEAVVRGYIIGSGWKDYQATGNICGVPLPAGLQLADKFAQPIFTPAAKADVGEHDENISFEQVVQTIGEPLAKQIRDVSIKLYETARDYAATRGIIIADTKFEFGLDDNGVLHLMDEALTPDSSRFWPADSYRPGISPPSYDKQFVRDWLETATVDGQPWNKRAPAPRLPLEVAEKTGAKYREALEKLTR